MSEDSDRVRRFVLEKHPIRGHAARLGREWLALREHQNHPRVVQELLGEAVGAALLLAATLKFDGTLTLQLQGTGQVNLLVAQCTHDFRVRGMARCAEIPSDEATFQSLAGSGNIIVTVEATDRASNYQGVVPITGASLAESLEAYFRQSEQLPTKVVLAATPASVVGMLVQRVPGVGGHQLQRDDDEVQRAWAQAEIAMTSLTREQLLSGNFEQRLVQMFGADEVRAYAGHDVRFECRCSRERVANVLRALGEDEVRSALAEQSVVTVTCEFCQKPYNFDAIDVEQLFGGAGPVGSTTIN